MTPASAIATLDRHLQLKGEDVLLRRTVGANTADVTCRAKVSGYSPQEIVSGTGLMQGDSQVILSPTQIIAAGWPGGAANQVVGDSRIPKTGDFVIISGRRRTVKAVVPVYMANVLVRIVMTVGG
jgi:hypothetical protein